MDIFSKFGIFKKIIIFAPEGFSEIGLRTIDSYGLN